MISKELLSEVMPEWMAIESSGKYTYEYGFDAIEFTLSFNDALGGKSLSYGKINIHELAHKCKEWAYAKGYDLYSTNGWAGLDPVGGDGGSCYWIDEFTSDTEPEAIFKACQWILENK